MTPKVLHIEPTDVCNAACPQCAREFDTTFDKSVQTHLTVEQIKELFSDDYIKQLDKVYMCGDYGDPAAGKNTLEIYKYFRSINPDIALGMNTNGSLRNAEWWEDLAQILRHEKDYVIFSIDGLEDTNHIYRINVNWQRLMDNVKTFIQAGGRAHWDMLVFEHNKHQVSHCEQLAKDLGFKWFRAKVSSRHNFVPIDFLKAPTGWQTPVITDGKIECFALKEKTLYVSAQGKIYPCCWLGPTNYTIDQFEEIQATWNTTPLAQCSTACTKGPLKEGTSFTNQWQREIEFK